MTADEPSKEPADVVRDARALADFIKGRNLRVLQAGVRPYLEVTFFARGERDTITEFFLELSGTLTDPQLTAKRVGDSVFLIASGTYKRVQLSFTLVAAEYEARLLSRELQNLGDAREHEAVVVSREALEAAVELMSTHADDCDLTCQQYGQVPCYADRAL